jgi:hypothetical protein
MNLHGIGLTYLHRSPCICRLRWTDIRVTEPDFLQVKGQAKMAESAESEELYVGGLKTWQNHTKSTIA